ncbi:alpha/beta fold hydrolase [Nonomuraea rhizosphaerae]|uniref:alpha/beta fold hydrolase n=1 Tax=Nonomuraea rhizosphaerae TaxID=2665663 RepID=UPI001C5E5214|nr:alpha/beta hydrolase [Nonomuraea rhizosphaerae]
MKPRPSPPGTADFVPLPDGRLLSYTEWGDPDGFPAFYFHGTPSSRLEGALAAGAAARHGFRLIAVDRPGYGRSAYQDGRTVTHWPHDVSALADALDLGEFGAVGHSGAGPYLLACGSLMGPERLRFVGALSPWGPVATPEIRAGLNTLDRLYARLARHTPWAMRISFAPLGWCARHRPGLFFSLMRSAVSPADQAALGDPRTLRLLQAAELEAFRQGSRGGAHEALIAYRDWGLDLETVHVPVHMWLGDSDIFVPVEMGRYMERAIPGADCHWMNGGGHFELDRWEEIFVTCSAHL